MRQAFLVSALVGGLAAFGFAQNLVQDQRRAQARTHHENGESYMQREAFERAVAEFERAIELYPEFTLAHYSLGQAHMALQQYPRAIDAYEACRQTIEDRKAFDLQRQGEMERERGEQIRDVEEALERWRRGYGAAPTETSMRLEEQLRLLRQERQKAMANDFSIPPEVSLALGSAYFRAGQFEDAEREYGEALEVDGGMGAAHNNLAVIYMMTDRLDQAREAVRRAEKAGFHVNPQFKEDLEQRRASTKEQ